MESGLSTGDLALMDRDNFGGGNSAFMWIFALLILANGGLGFGNRGYQPQYATQDFVQNGFNFNDLQDQNRELMTEMNSNTNLIVGTIKDAAYQNLMESRDIEQGVAALAASQQKCCCDTLRAIDGVNYNGALNTASINATTTAQTQKILDALTENKMAEMQNRINTLELQSALCGVVRYPMGTTYTSNCNPFTWGGGCGCGNI